MERSGVIVAQTRCQTSDCHLCNSENEHQEQTGTVPKMSPRPTIFNLIIIIFLKIRRKIMIEFRRKELLFRGAKNKNCIPYSEILQSIV